VSAVAARRRLDPPYFHAPLPPELQALAGQIVATLAHLTPVEADQVIMFVLSATSCRAHYGMNPRELLHELWPARVAMELGNAVDAFSIMETEAAMLHARRWLYGTLAAAHGGPTH